MCGFLEGTQEASFEVRMDTAMHYLAVTATGIRYRYRQQITRALAVKLWQCRPIVDNE